MMRYLLLGILWLGVAFPVLAQAATVTAAFKVDNGAPLIGEPVHMTLTVEVPNEALTITGWPEFETWPQPFLVKTVGERTETLEGGTRVYQQALTVVLWQTGDFQTPETSITYQLPGVAETHEVAVQPAFFTVPSVLDGTDMSLRPLKPPVWLPYVSPWLLLAIGTGVLVVVGGSGYWLWSRARHRRLAAAASTPAQTAFDELDRLNQHKLSMLELYTLVADCLRAYVQNRLEIPARDMTTDELIAVLETSGQLPVKLHKDLARLLKQSDLVKFARFEPNMQSAHRLVAIARNWIEQVETAAQMVVEEA